MMCKNVYKCDFTVARYVCRSILPHFIDAKARKVTFGMYEQLLTHADAKRASIIENYVSKLRLKLQPAFWNGNIPWHDHPAHKIHNCRKHIWC